MAVGLRLNNEMIRISVGTRLGARTCEPHTYLCGKTVVTRELHDLFCRKRAARHQRHSNLNDIIWRAFKGAQISAVKEPVGLSRSDGKRPHGATLIPWARGKALTWDVTVRDTFSQLHVDDTAILTGAAATKKDVQVSTSDRHQHLYASCYRKLEAHGRCKPSSSSKN